MENSNIFKALFDIIESRKFFQPEESYTASLMDKGEIKINSRLIEEANEVCEASLEKDKTDLISEVCDLLFHTFVLCSFKNIELEEVENELKKRFCKSGLKKIRGKSIKK